MRRSISMFREFWMIYGGLDFAKTWVRWSEQEMHLRREMKRMNAGEKDMRRKLYRALQKFFQLLGGSVKICFSLSGKNDSYFRWCFWKKKKKMFSNGQEIAKNWNSIASYSSKKEPWTSPKIVQVKFKILAASSTAESGIFLKLTRIDVLGVLVQSRCSL